MGNESVALRSLELDGRENLPLEGEGVRGSFVGGGETTTRVGHCYLFVVLI